MSVALLWTIVGVGLIISELLATSFVAVFIGTAAIMVGLLAHFDVVTSLTWQMTAFSVLSIALTVSLRRYCSAWFMGGTRKDLSNGATPNTLVSERVIVVSDFVNGQGRVRLNGVEWDATSTHPLEKGDFALVMSNKGIQLHIEKLP